MRKKYLTFSIGLIGILLIVYIFTYKKTEEIIQDIRILDTLEDD